MGLSAVEGKMYAGTIEEMAKNRKFYPSDNFIITCGCVTLDPARKKVLLVLNKKFDIYQLPKGRKNLGEDLLAAALRETREETGVSVRALPLSVPTRATRPSADRSSPSSLLASSNGPGCDDRSRDPAVTADVRNCEPCAVVHAPDPYSGAMKHVFYFVAQADSTVPPVAGTQEAWERFETVWAAVGDAPGMLAFEEDGMVVERALDVARSSGIDT